MVATPLEPGERGRADGTFAVVTGGGTSGHVLPAIAVAEALIAAGHDARSIHYVGARRGIETRLVPQTALAHTFLDVVGFQRRLSGTNLAFVVKMVRARREAIALLRRLRPQVVVSVGGYASMPAVFAARRLGVPVVVVSYDRRPGRASVLAARRAAACAVAFPDSTLPCATLTGAPIRQAVLDVDRVAGRAAARRQLGIADDRFLVAVMGGSQGSGALNTAVADLLTARHADAGLAVRHAAGERFLSRCGPARDGVDGVLYQPIGYEPDMPVVHAAADVLVGRGGASTVHEVAVTGIPAVLVPWPLAAEDHQTGNVKWLADAGAAILLPEAEIGRLGAVLEELRHDPARRAAMSERASELGRVHRSGALATLIASVAAPFLG